MSGGYGPPLLDFSPIGDLFSTFANSQDHTRKRKLEDLQLQAGDEWAKKLAESIDAGTGAPAAPAAPSLATVDQPPAYNAQGKAPTFAAMQGVEPSANLAEMFSDKERQYALPAGYLSRTAYIESRYNPNAQNPNSSAGGLFQFIDGTAKQYGLSDKFNPAAATDAAARLAADNSAYLSNRLGRQPTAG